MHITIQGSGKYFASLRSKRKVFPCLGRLGKLNRSIELNVSQKLESYPDHIREKLKHLRSLVYQVANDIEAPRVEESLKWGELTYSCKGGSPLRIGIFKDPKYYAMYFHCQSKLIETIKEVYGETFEYSGRRAILFPVDGSVPEKELKHCISLALKYHSLKSVPLLGC